MRTTHAARSPPGLNMRRRLVFACLATAICAAIRGAQAASPAFDIRLQDERVRDGERVVRVKEGDVVTLRVASDRPLVLHLHGYDVEWRVRPGVVSETTFAARLTGRFPVHAHDAPASGRRTNDETAVFYVEVYPR